MTAALNGARHNAAMDDPSAAPRRADAHVRVSPTDRERAEQLLRRAAGDGLLTLEQYGERVGGVLGAQTRGELDLVVADLPAPTAGGGWHPAGAGQVEVRPQRHSVRSWVVALLGDSTQQGRWRPAEQTHVVAVMGDATIDLCLAEVDPGGITIDAVAVMGDVDVVVPDGVEIELGGVALLGDKTSSVEGVAHPGAPVVRVNAYAVMGDVEVRRPRDKDLKRQRRLRRGGPAGEITRG